MKARFDALGAAGVRTTGAVPVILRLPERKAAGLEES